MRQNKFKAVIIDDELLIRELLRKTVDWEQHGFEVIGEAADGVEGLELIGRVRPDIAVVDMNMPRMDGCTLCRNISELHPDCKIIVLSGYNEFDYVRSALLAGARDYLLKPIEPTRVEQVLDRLRNELEEKSQQHEQDERNDKFYKISRENFLKGLVSSRWKPKIGSCCLTLISGYPSRFCLSSCGFPAHLICSRMTGREKPGNMGFSILRKKCWSLPRDVILSALTMPSQSFLTARVQKQKSSCYFLDCRNW